MCVSAPNAKVNRQVKFYMVLLQAQVMKGKACDVRMDGVHRPSQTSIPVMFFGTLEIAWISPNDLNSWADGIKSKMHTKPKGRKAFDNSLRQVCAWSHSLSEDPVHQHALCWRLLFFWLGRLLPDALDKRRNCMPVMSSMGVHPQPRCQGLCYLQVADFALYKKWPQNWWARRPPQPRAKEDAAAAADRC